MSHIIKAEHLSKHYGALRAVDDVSFSVQAGEVYGFLGQNGAGKSTTIRMLLTLVRPSHGSIEIFGMKLYAHRREILRQVGAVIERPDLYKYLTGYENLSIFARLSGRRFTEKKLMDQLDRVGLQERAHSKVHTYSQGMQQRLGLAVALVHDPKLILLDEPTNGLDPQGIAEVRQLLRQLSRQEGKTVFVSSHLLNEIELIADRMLILDKGKKIVEGAVRDLFDPSGMLVELRVTNPDHTLRQLRASTWSGAVKDVTGECIVLQVDREAIPALTAELVQKGALIQALQPRHSLEAYFLSLTTPSRHVDTFQN